MLLFSGTIKLQRPCPWMLLHIHDKLFECIWWKNSSKPQHLSAKKSSQSRLRGVSSNQIGTKNISCDRGDFGNRWN